MTIAADYDIHNISRVAGEIRLGRCLAPVLTGENWDDLVDCANQFTRLKAQEEQEGIPRDYLTDAYMKILEKYHGCFVKIHQAIQDECNNPQF